MSRTFNAPSSADEESINNCIEYLRHIEEVLHGEQRSAEAANSFLRSMKTYDALQRTSWHLSDAKDKLIKDYSKMINNMENLISDTEKLKEQYPNNERVLSLYNRSEDCKNEISKILNMVQNFG